MRPRANAHLALSAIAATTVTVATTTATVIQDWNSD